MPALNANSILVKNISSLLVIFTLYNIVIEVKFLYTNGDIGLIDPNNF